MHKQKEFDKYIKNYRSNCDKALWLSGESSDYFAHYKAQKLFEWFRLKRFYCQKVLDFGCGDGLMTNYVSQLFSKAKVFGVDPSQESITHAKKKFSHIKFSTNDTNSTKLTFENNSFDLIFSAGTFHHIPVSMHEPYIRELFRILKPGGSIVIFELNPLNPLTIYTFKNNPIDANATMLFPWYARNLGKHIAQPYIKFICFFPKALKFLRFLEPLLTKVPIGALYAVIIKKKHT